MEMNKKIWIYHVNHKTNTKTIRIYILLFNKILRVMIGFMRRTEQNTF